MCVSDKAFKLKEGRPMPSVNMVHVLRLSGRAALGITSRRPRCLLTLQQRFMTSNAPPSKHSAQVITAMTAITALVSCVTLAYLNNQQRASSQDKLPRLGDAMKKALPFSYGSMGKHKLVDRLPFMQAIKECLVADSYGTFVVWAPRHSGKSTYIRQEAEKWVKDGKLAGKTRHVCWISSYHNPVGKTVCESLNVQDTDDLQAQLTGTNFEVLVVLDQFDQAFGRNDALLRSDVVGLTAASVSSKKFRVVIGMHNHVWAAQVLSWNARKKIHLCGGLKSGMATKISDFKWTATEEACFLANPDSMDWTKEDKQAYINAGCQSGNIDTMILLKSKAQLHEHPHQIKADEDLWSKGISYLNEHAHEQSLV